MLPSVFHRENNFPPATGSSNAQSTFAFCRCPRRRRRARYPARRARLVVTVSSSSFSALFPFLAHGIFLRLTQNIKRMEPGIETAHGLVLAPIARALSPFSVRAGSDIARKNLLAVPAQVALDFFEQLAEFLRAQRLTSAPGEFAVLLFGEFELIAFVLAPVVQFKNRRRIKPT